MSPILMALLLLFGPMIPAPSYATCPQYFAAVEPGNKYALTPMHKGYVGEEGQVVYLNAKSAERYKAKVSNGQIVDFQNQPLEGRYIFVMDGKGALFITNHNQGGVFHHSSLVAGNPVASAGTMIFDKGKLFRITSSSGHYRPTKQYFEQVLTELHERGVSTKGVEIVAYDEMAKNILFWGVGTGAAGAGLAVLWQDEQ